MPMDARMMLQRQVEVAGAFRSPPSTPEELARTRLIVKDLSQFILHISRLATKLQLPLESVFQCLMQMGLGSQDGLAFDKQARQGNVPMHQAKVLDRNAALNAQNVEPKIREAVEPAVLERHVSHCSDLRRLMRMKVEDGNDLSMARKLVSLAEEYLDHIHQLAAGDLALMHKLYLADDEASIHSLMGSAHHNQNAPSAAAHRVSLPYNVVKGVVDVCHGALDSLKPEFGKRQLALQTICSWVQQISHEALGGVAAAIFVALQEPLKVQLGDKRSAVSRLACDIVSTLVIRVPHDVLELAKTKEVLFAWVDVLLKGVHVTVAAIAEATDVTMRDIIICSHGGSYLLQALSATLSKAAQPELRRKLLNYLVLALTVCVKNKKKNSCIGDSSLSSTLVQLAVKLCGSSEESCRRLARMMLVILEQEFNAVIPALDPKTAKIVTQEQQGVMDCVDGPLDAFEVIALRYSEPCRAVKYHDIGDTLFDPPIPTVQIQDTNAVVSTSNGSHSATAEVAVPSAPPASSKQPHSPIRRSFHTVDVLQPAEAPEGSDDDDVQGTHCDSPPSHPVTTSGTTHTHVPHKKSGSPEAQALPGTSNVRHPVALVSSSKAATAVKAAKTSHKTVDRNSPPSGVKPRPLTEKPRSSSPLPDITNSTTGNSSFLSAENTMPGLPLSLRTLSLSTGSLNASSRQLSSSAGGHSPTEGDAPPSATLLTGSLKRRLSQRQDTVFQ